MCIPTPQVAAPPPVDVPSMQAADNLQLGGAARGAAQIGRLALRIGTPNSAVSGSAAQAAQPPATPSAPNLSPVGAAPASTPPAGSQIGANNPALIGAAPGAYTSVANPSLRIGAH